MVNDLIVAGVDGIAVSPSNAAAMASALAQAKAAGIPVLTWDSDLLPENQDLRIAYVGTKNYDIGVNLAKIAQAKKPNGGKICLQTGGASAAKLTPSTTISAPHFRHFVRMRLPRTLSSGTA